MKTYMPLDGFRWSCDSDSTLCDIPQTNVLGRAGGGDEFMIAHEPVSPNKSSEHVSDMQRSNHQYTKPIQSSNSSFTYSSGLTCRQAPSSRNRR